MGAHTRATDPPLFKVTREIPLPWLLGIVGATVMSAMTLYFGQQKQTEQIAKMSAQMEKVVDSLAAGTQKAAEHDFKLMDLDRRTSALELRQGRKP